MKNFAFTLAEVLITLGVIGVIAALTIPTLVGSYKKSEYSVRLKKFYSTMQQARMMYNAENGTMDTDWEFPRYNNSSDLISYWNKYFAPYFKNVTKTEYKTSNGLSGLFIYFTDGSSLRIKTGGAIDFDYDVNNEQKSPNQLGKDKFFFTIQRIDNKLTPYGWVDSIESENKNHPDEPPLSTNLNDRDNVQKLCKRNGIYCSQLLFLDGWEFKDDYPYKL